jgi:sodium-dependent dicarboxylate transporter 2/3/5
MIGGMMTPAGSSINMLAINMLEKNTGETIPFVNWMIMGIPLAVIMLPIAWILCCKIFKPAPLDKSVIDKYIEGEQQKIPKKMTGKEKYVIIVLLGMLILWIASSWVPFFNITAVALIGLMLYCLPGKANILTWKEFAKSVSLEAFFLMGVMISMGAVITSTGLSGWISATIFPASLGVPTIVFLIFIAVITFLLLIPIPVAPALITMLSAPLIGLAMASGVSPVLTMAAFGLCACNCYFLPLDTVPLMTYATGSYDMFDMPKVAVIIQIIIVFVSAAWLTICGMIFGL